MFDWSEGDHDEGQGGVGGVEAVGPVDDQPDSPIQSFVAGIVDPEPDRSEDPGPSFPECLGRRDEGLQAAAGGLRAEPVQQQTDLVFAQVTGEDRAQGLLQGIGPPKLASLAFELAQRHGLLIVEVLRILQQRPTGALEWRATARSGSWRSSCQTCRRTFSSALVASWTTWNGS